MCGIVAFNGKENAEERILQGLEKLEYRGYDSAGIAKKNFAPIPSRATTASAIPAGRPTAFPAK